MTVDVATFVGSYPYRQVTGGTAQWLLEQMDRLEIETAWVGSLASFLHTDPAPANADLTARLADHHRLLPVPTIQPGLPGWERDLDWAREIGASAVRAYPQFQGVDPGGTEMVELGSAVAAAGLPLVLTVRFEDSRQRHPTDVAGDLPAAAVRKLAREDERLRILVTSADRRFIEEVHFGLTPEESRRVLWEISWVWGPPENHLQALLETVGGDRFTLGTGMPLRIPDSAHAKLGLLDGDARLRAAIRCDNLARWQRP